MVKRDRLLQVSLVTLVALAAAAMASAAYAQDPPVTLRLSHWSPPQHPMAAIATPEWANSIEKASNGSIKIQIFPAGQLGKPEDHFDMARDGVADITWANVGLQPGRFPVAQAIEMPGLYKDPQGATMAFQEWYAPLAEKEMKDVKVCLAHALYPSEIHSKKEFKAIEEFKGLKMRTPNSTQARFFSSLGSVIIPIPATQARDAVDKGVADAVSFPWQSLIIFGIDTLLSYHLDVPIGGNGFELLINKNAYNKLTDNQKKVIDDHCTPERSRRFMEVWNGQERDGRAVLAGKAGHMVYPASEKLASDLHAAAEPARKEWADSVRKAGLDPDKIWADLTAAMKKYNAM